jgi:hypothetical protein
MFGELPYCVRWLANGKKGYIQCKERIGYEKDRIQYTRAANPQIAFEGI